MPSDVCGKCKTQYELTEEKDYICIYLKDPRCNHIVAHCPCGYVTRLFCGPEIMYAVHDQAAVPVHLYVNAPPDMLKLASQLFDRQSVTAEVEPPREWIVQLMDDLRRFGEGKLYSHYLRMVAFLSPAIAAGVPRLRSPFV